jgi:large subunit ribosomal protein L19
MRKIEEIGLKKNIQDFGPGDSVKVHMKVVEGESERVQIFDGVVIAKKGSGIGATFTVRKISFGVGVERIFPLHSPRVTKVEITKKGKVRRAKLYYLRDLKGKAARLQEKVHLQDEAKGVSAGKTPKEEVKQQTIEEHADASSTKVAEGSDAKNTKPVYENVKTENKGQAEDNKQQKTP